jgi:hypothetical protein
MEESHINPARLAMMQSAETAPAERTYGGRTRGKRWGRDSQAGFSGGRRNGRNNAPGGSGANKGTLGGGGRSFLQNISAPKKIIFDDDGTAPAPIVVVIPEAQTTDGPRKRKREEIVVQEV